LGWSDVTEEDYAALREWLGREPHRVLAVARRGQGGEPQVVVNDPLRRDKRGLWVPFPTLFWLAAPSLVKAVDQLESEGWIGRLREALVGDVAEQMHQAHREHARLRMQLCNRVHLEEMKRQNPALVEVVAETGVGGMRRQEGVKCLHAHLADYLGRPAATEASINPVGRWTANLLSQRGIDLDPV